MSASKRKGRKGRLMHGAEMDLKPMMNLFVVLIPFLLACAQFAKITLVDIKLPENRGSQTKVAVKKKPKQEESLNLTVLISDLGITIGAKGGFLPSIHYREFHKYSSLTDKHEFTVEYDPKKPDEKVFSPSDKKKMTPQERMEIILISCERENPEEKGVVNKGIYNKLNQALTTETGILVEEVKPGDILYTVPKREQEKVAVMSDYTKKPLSAYDKLATALLQVKARYQGLDMPDADDIIVASEDQICYDKIIQIIDICRVCGFPNVSIAKLRG